MSDEIFDEEQNGPSPLFLVSFWPIAFSVHELSCFHRFAYKLQVIGCSTDAGRHEPLLSIFNLPETASLVSP